MHVTPPSRDAHAWPFVSGLARSHDERDSAQECVRLPNRSRGDIRAQLSEPFERLFVPREIGNLRSLELLNALAVPPLLRAPSSALRWHPPRDALRPHEDARQRDTRRTARTPTYTRIAERRLIATRLTLDHVPQTVARSPARGRRAEADPPHYVVVFQDARA